MKIIKYNSIANTNSALLEMSKKDAKSWTAVWTSHQTEGRGYAGNKWEAEKDQNIALSLLIKSELSYQDLIYFNQWVCSSVAGVLSQYTDGVFVKWPNDIIVKDKKVCGVLIETHKSDNEMCIIVGIGLNVNQIHFENHPKAGSLATQTGRQFSLDEILADLLTHLKNDFKLMEEKRWEEISKGYHSVLYKRNQWNEFQSKGEYFQASIQSVDEFGRLVVLLKDGESKSFMHKEIEMIY